MNLLFLLTIVLYSPSLVLPLPRGAQENDETTTIRGRNLKDMCGMMGNCPPPTSGARIIGEGLCPDGFTPCSVDSDCKTCRKSGENCVKRRDCKGNRRKNKCEPVADGSGFCALPPPTKKPLKIIILTGQSNAQGHGKEEHLDALLKRTPGTPSLYDLDTTFERLGHLRDGANWSQHDNVYITYHSANTKTATFNYEEKGQLTAVKFGANENKLGPEVGLGWELARLVNDDEQQFLIIKVAWGGASLYGDFRPPSNSDDINEAFPEPNEGFGWAYRALVSHVQDTLDNIDSIPNYDPEAGYELEGLVYFQGFNDVLKPAAVEEYVLNLQHLVMDLRNDLNEPNLKIVIGELGMHGPFIDVCPAENLELCSIDPSCTIGPRYCERARKLRLAQRFVATMDSVVGFAETGIYNYGHIKDETNPDFKTVTDPKQSHHYYANADTFYYIGESMARAMYDLMTAV